MTREILTWCVVSRTDGDVWLQDEWSDHGEQFSMVMSPESALQLSDALRTAAESAESAMIEVKSPGGPV